MSTDAIRPSLTVFDQRLAEVKDDLGPGWLCWYVPTTTDGVRWCARREPLLNCDSPDQLRKAAAEADAELAERSVR